VTTAATHIEMSEFQQRLLAARPMLMPILLIGLMAVIVVPLPPLILDVLLAGNLALAALVLMTTMFVSSPLDFSVFPSLLLFTTFFRLALNIATTRLILGADAASPEAATAAAGKVIEAFANFVTGSSMVVGVILFAILVIIQFVVITKGATRISEVAARFTLDGMPGKQMAIDAGLNAGLINEKEARERRERIGQEADFHGAMDGASKFVRGDAIAGIIITLVNIVGGLTIGMLVKGWTFTESAEVFTKLTIGDGLVSQLPAFIIALASGLLVTRSSSRRDLGQELTGQLTSKSAALGVTSGFLAVLAFVGLPLVPMLSLAAGTGLLAWMVRRDQTRVAANELAAANKKEAVPEPEPVEQAMQVDALELEVGYALVKLVDAQQGGDLLERVTMIRRQLAAEQGFVMPPLRIRDNMQLGPNDYHLKVRGNTVASGQLFPDQFLAMDGGMGGEGESRLTGMRTREPAFGLDAVWIDAGQKQRAESLNHTVVDPSSVLATHLTEVVKAHADELLSREETGNLITQLKDKAPKLAGEVLEGETALVKPGELQKVLQNLLRERVPIRDMETIVETLGDWAPRSKDLDVLTEYVRNALRRTICGQYLTSEPDDTAPEGAAVVHKLYCVSLDPAVEDQINGYIQRSNEGTSLSMPPAVANRITAAVVEQLQRLVAQGRHPVVLASPQVRAQVRALLEPHLPTAAVLGYNEIGRGVQVEAVAMVQVEPAAGPTQPAAEPTADDPWGLGPSLAA
jgi:flagellar biosynthesis protein FlhA